MTTFIPVLPSNTSAPPFQTVILLDGQSYSFSLAWNIYGMRYYFKIIDQSGNLVINAPLISSPPNSDIPLAPGRFKNSAIVFRGGTSILEVTP